MAGDPAQVQERRRIGGIKVSPELAVFSYCRPRQEPCLLTSALTEIASRHITIHGLSLYSSPEEICVFFSVDASHGGSVEAILGASLMDPTILRHDPCSVNVTLFPHRNELTLFGRAIIDFATPQTCAGHTISSISGLTLTTTQQCLDDTLNALLAFLELPENHAPLAPQSILVDMVETVAVYHEPVIRVYGFDTVRQLALIDMRFPARDSAFWGRQLMELGAAGHNFRLVMQQMETESTCRCHLLVSRESGEKCCKHLENSAQKGYTLTIGMTQPVELLFFHGPHFQDRPGIAAALFGCLGKGTTVPYLIGLSGTSIYLVVGDNEAEAMKALLASDFIVP